MFQYFSTVSNVADEGEEDKSDNEGQEQVSDNLLDSQIDDEMKTPSQLHLHPATGSQLHHP